MKTGLRLTHWLSPDLPMTIVIDSDDMTISPAEAIEDMVGQEGFFTYEVFEVAEVDFVRMVVEGAARAQERTNPERNQAIAYHYYTQMLGSPQIGAHTVIAGTVPQPLSREEVAWVFRNVSKHENYKGQRIIAPIEGGAALVEMVNGEVLPA